ncbi:MAG: hypothetical protein QF733_02100 [Phycisphaerales bacterium]|jgi:hypothetical protein|nr:hypothetical protein [Phycisphaerales bacterium]
MDRLSHRIGGGLVLMPWADWQFWVVSVAAIAAMGFALRPLVKRAVRRGRASGGWKRTTLTHEGRHLARSRRSSEHD